MKVFMEDEERGWIIEERGQETAEDWQDNQIFIGQRKMGGGSVSWE